MSHLMISAAHKSSGKTTVSIGLCAALAKRGQVVQPFKKGPDYIDPLWLSQAAGRPCYNLDFYTMAATEIIDTVATQMVGADIGIIEGNKGLYDGLALDGSNSNAALAKLVDAPVILVLDAQGITRGIAPLILGYQAFDPQVRIAGVILNKIAGSRHEGKLLQVIEHYTDVPVIGAVGRSDEMVISERHLGLTPSNEAAESQGYIDRFAERVGAQVDLGRLLEIAQGAGALPSPIGRARLPIPDVRIGYASDAAFGFYYPGDMRALEAAGAELVPFSPISDQSLPEVDGIFLGGGFPETAMEALAANHSMRAAVRRFIDQGRPVYAECGGLMYLTRSLRWGDRQAEMVGAIPADTVMHDKPQGRGYVRLTELDSHPWPTLPGQPEEIAAHEFHYSGLENISPQIGYAYTVNRGHGVDGAHDGIIYKNVLANYTHMRDVGGNHWAQRFVAHVRNCRASSGQ